jgi:hypothetical protein
MSTGLTSEYNLPYPLPSDPVNVAGDIKSLADQIDAVLPTINLPYHSINIINNSGVTISKGDPVYISGYSVAASKPEISKSDNNFSNTFPAVGLAQTAISDGASGTVILSGTFSNINTSSFIAGDSLYVDFGGGLTNVYPETGTVFRVGVVAFANLNGIIIVGMDKE